MAAVRGAILWMYLVLRSVSAGPAPRVGDELELLPGRPCGQPAPGSAERHQCKPGDRGRVLEASGGQLKILWYSSGIATSVTDTAWEKSFWLSAEARTLTLGDMLRPLPRVAFGEGPDLSAGDGAAQGVVVRTDDKVTSVLVYSTGLQFQIPSATWYMHTIFVRTGVEFNIGEEVQVIPNQGFASGALTLASGMKGRVVEAPVRTSEASLTEVLRFSEGSAAVIDGSARKYMVKRAWWGARDMEWQVGPGAGLDVTDKVRDLLTEGRTISPSVDVFTDPALTSAKQLSIEIFREGSFHPMYYVGWLDNEGALTFSSSINLDEARDEFQSREADIVIGMSLNGDLEDLRLIRSCERWEFASTSRPLRCERQPPWIWLSMVGMNATQSSTFEGDAFAIRAIDGHPERRIWDQKSCTSTLLARPDVEWWEVDLGRTHEILGLRLYNRANCCPYRLNGFHALVDGLPCATDVQITDYRDVSCKAIGRRVRIIQPDGSDALTICELMVAVVPVFNSPNLDEERQVTEGCASGATPWECEMQKSWMWLPLTGKTARQSSTWKNEGSREARASNAIDGFPDLQEWAQNSCSNTQIQDEPWWEVDLGRHHEVLGLRVFNRIESFARVRTNGFDVLVDGTSCATNVTFTDWRAVSVRCAAIGRRIVIRLPRRDAELNLCEVWVAVAVPDSNDHELTVRSKAGTAPQVVAQHVEDLRRRIRQDYLINHKVYVAWYKLGITTHVADAFRRLQLLGEAHRFRNGDEVAVLDGFSLTSPDGTVYGPADCQPGDKGRVRLTKAPDVLELRGPSLCAERAALAGRWERRPAAGDGRGYYKARAAMAFLFFGVSCNETAPRWWITPRQPDVTDVQGLASGDGCEPFASLQLDGNSASVPESAVWQVACGGEWVDQTLTFKEASMLEATWYRTAQTTRCPLSEWPAHFKLVSQVHIPELGQEFRRLTKIRDGQDQSHVDDELQHTGRVILKNAAEDVLQFKMYSGDVETTKLTEWFVGFMYVESALELRVSEELEALPDSQWCDGGGDTVCPIAARMRGRVGKLGEARFAVVWLSAVTPVVTNHNKNTWYRFFRRSAEAKRLEVGDEVEWLIAVTADAIEGPLQSRPVEPGTRGRVFALDPLDSSTAMVAWYPGVESRVDIDTWMWRVNLVGPALVLSPFIELEVLAKGMNVTGVVLQIGLRGRIVSIDQATYDVMWYSGVRLTYEAGEWLRQFKYVGKGHHMELGDEVMALPGVNMTGADGLVYDGGHKGRVVNADKEKYSVIWFGSGIQSDEAQTCWSCRFMWTGKKAPQLTEGMELKVLPRSVLSRADCEEIYKPGWEGRIYSYAALSGELCVRWYEISAFTCFNEPSWIRNFELLDEVHVLSVGDELALLNGEGCPVEVVVTDSEAREDNEIGQEVRMDDRFGNTELSEMMRWFAPSEFLSRFAGGRGSEGRLLAKDGAQRSHEPMETCQEATLVNKPGQFVVKFKSRGSVADRGRIYSIEGDTFCIMWYLGKASCASLGRWYQRFQLTDQAPHLVNGSVVEALPIDGAEAAWNTTRFTWGEVTQVDQEKNLLCVTWGTDVQQICVQGLWRWPTSLRFVNRTRLDAQTYDVSQYDIVKVAKVTDALRNSSDFFALGNISEGSEGFISYIDDRDFCVSWKAKKCCTCHPKLELSDLTFAVVREAKKSQKGDEWWWDCSEQERKPSDTCLPLTAADRLPAEVPEKGTLDWLVPVVIVLLCAAAIAAVFVIRAKTKQTDVEEADVIDEVELAQTNQEVHIAGLSDAWGVVSEAVVCGSAMGTSQSATLDKDNNVSVKVAMLSKFNNENDGMVPCLKSGEPGAAAKGVVQFLKIESKMASFHKDGLQAIVEEWEQALEDLGEREEHNDVLEEKRFASKFLGLLKYIVEEEADEIEELSNDGVSSVTRDTGNKGKKLADFHAMSESTKANLTLPEVAALRIYTSSLFRLINEPFREPVNRDGFVEPHPVGITVYAISEGLKKLRGLYAYGEATNSKVSFWRGMKDLQLPETFMDQGGTELQCMSTTTDLSVASAYGLSKRPLLFCIKSDNFMTRGADISWLSLYPHEKEILYPPLTYLKPIGQRRIQNSEGLVVYVTPHLS